MKKYFTKEKPHFVDKPINYFIELVNNRGFTLVELSIVVVILGVLITLAIPLFSDTTSNANKTVCHSRLYELRSVEEAYNMLHGTHTEEYINETALNQDSGLLEFFDDDTTITCPKTGEYYYWDTRDGVKMLFCPEHGTDNPAVINEPPPVPVTYTLFMELVQNYTEDRITYLEFSDAVQRMSMGADLVYGTDQVDIIRGRAGEDLIDGGGGDDKIYGNNHNDGIFGGDGNDYIHGGNGDDLLTGGNGDDRIIGGNGNDTVVYDKSFEAYTITKINNNKFFITDNETGEKDRVEFVETFQFGEDDELTVQGVRNLFN